MTDVVVVESPAKAKTINKYLGGGYTVLASFGHVRDLPPKDGSVRPDENFAMDWATDDRGAKHMGDIARALKSAKSLYLATDPDREGEAISWHVQSVLAERNLLKNISVQRVTFNEITKSAVQRAMANPRALDQPLIDAYLARRALDYLVGFTLSPVLWRKLPGSRSAGRVQSVALRLICEREAEIEVFKKREYWSVKGLFEEKSGQEFLARLTHLHGKKLEQFDLENAEAAEAARALVAAGQFSVSDVEHKKIRRNPSPPFTTSTLQQEASRKLGMSAQVTMRTAQQLYEGVDIGGEHVGLITYMRTDGVQMAAEAISAIRSHILDSFGKEYQPEKPRVYSSKAKNAQEAHEAIRPTDVRRRPEDVTRHLNHDQSRLYELIYKRAVAAQMSSAELDQVSVTLTDGQNTVTMRATGTTIAFDGFLRLYREGRDDIASEDDENRLLPPMTKGDPVQTKDAQAEQHFTQPPPRYSEASLVKKMEEIGIGRPSTYASILSVLRDRSYVRLDSRRFVPEDRGRLVTAFLTSFFETYVDTDFTARLEEQLDDISDGRADWHDVMRAFWKNFSHAVDQTKDLKISDVIDALDEDLGAYFFPLREDGGDPRQCTACGSGRLGLRLGKFGAFIGCSNYPTCQFTRRLIADDGAEAPSLKEGIRHVGMDAETGEELTIRRGPYGLYVQRGEADPADKKKKPKRVALPKNVDAETLSLEQAQGYISLPRKIGPHPESGEMMEAGLGRFGPFIKMGGIYATLGKDDDVLTVGANRAVDCLAQKLASIRNLGKHPKDEESVMVRKGRFGPYVQHGQIIATLPRGSDMDDVTLDEAVTLLAEKGKPLKAPVKKGVKKAASSAKKPVTDKKATAKTPKKAAASAAPRKRKAAKAKQKGPDAS
ncbi:DNA topoisomerase 1 [Acetobacteraceae bacterium EV16G]